MQYVMKILHTSQLLLHTSELTLVKICSCVQCAMRPSLKVAITAVMREIALVKKVFLCDVFYSVALHVLFHNSLP